MNKNPVLPLFICFVFCFVFSTKSQNKAGFYQASEEEFQIWMDSSTQHLIIDVRDTNEIRTCRIMNAIFLPTKDDLWRATDTIDYDTPLLVYCTYGKRSRIVCQLLIDKGFKKVVNLQKGLNDWQKMDKTRLEIQP